MNHLEEHALRLGLNNCIVPPVADNVGIQIAFEKFTRFSYGKVTDSDRSSFICRTRHLMNTYISSSFNACNTFSNKSIHKTVRNLKKNANMKICRFDKGNGTQVMNSKEYHAKLDDIALNDKFVEVEVHNDICSHPVIKTERAIQYYLGRYIKSHATPDVYRAMYPIGSSPGAIYGMAKVHKQGIPLRPVISMINTPQYGLARYLDDSIKPCIPKRFMLASSTDFVESLSKIEFPAQYAMVSFDVVSLFTNVPLDDAINTACEYVYSDESPSKPTYDKRHFHRLLKFATSGEFMYREKLYKQIDGVAKGSPLGPTLANLFLAHLEQN